MGHRPEQSIERAVAIALLVCALLVAVVGAAAGAFLRSHREGDARATPLADSVAAAVSGGMSPQPVLAMLVRAGAIRSATFYRHDGTLAASAGHVAPNGEVICRSVADGGTVCIEPAAGVRETATPEIIATATSAIAAALVIGGVMALLLAHRIAGRLDSMRHALETSARVPPSRGALGALADSANHLIDDLQQRDLILRRRTLELETANKDLEAFASAVSHDLRGPLGSITGFAQALEEDFSDQLEEGASECVRWIRDGCEQMRKLIDGLLQVARVSRAEIQREDVDLSAIARQIADSLVRANPDRTVDFAIADGVVANGDERMLRAVLENLISNAWKFTSKLPHARIEIGVRNDDGRPAFFVRDNGAGFDPAHAAKMFRPFQRLHSEKEFSGTGIGLATVQKIVQRHGGRAWAEGEPERGATVYFTV